MQKTVRMGKKRKKKGGREGLLTGEKKFGGQKKAARRRGANRIPRVVRPIYSAPTTPQRMLDSAPATGCCRLDFGPSNSNPPGNQN